MYRSILLFGLLCLSFMSPCAMGATVPVGPQVSTNGTCGFHDEPSMPTGWGPYNASYEIHNITLSGHGEAMTAKQPVLLYKPDSVASQCLGSIADKLLRRVETEPTRAGGFSDFFEQQMLEAPLEEILDSASRTTAQDPDGQGSPTTDYETLALADASRFARQLGLLQG